jgi:CheY-like chemotaxis protein
MLGTKSERQLPLVLLIDDDMVSREVMATVLTMSGYTVHTAVEGSEAVAMLEAKVCAPDVILMDTQMPGLSGVKLIEQLRARSNAVLYAVSASEPPAEVTAATDGFLMKPLSPSTLEGVLQSHAKPIVPAPAEDIPVVSPVILAQLRGLMAETAVKEIYVAMVADLERRLVGLKMAVARGDGVEVKRIGHSIKGGCGMAGAMQAARLGGLLEAQSNQLDNIRARVDELQEAIRNLQSMLDAEFSNQ